MTNALMFLAIVGAMAGAVASALIWTLLTDPSSIATAFVSGDFVSLMTAVLDAWL
ncbi:MAG TPA: hypothetical protein VNK41_12715 [Vicinamibacterales bacterium]|nr:hypothetical protein [Vicinamibacterales bacterium]